MRQECVDFHGLFPRPVPSRPDAPLPGAGGSGGAAEAAPGAGPVRASGAPFRAAPAAPAHGSRGKGRRKRGWGRDGTSPADRGCTRANGAERRVEEGRRARLGTVRAVPRRPEPGGAAGRAEWGGGGAMFLCRGRSRPRALPSLGRSRCSGPAAGRGSTAGRGSSLGSGAAPSPQEPAGHRGQVGAWQATGVPSGAVPVVVPGRSERGRARRFLPSAVRAGGPSEAGVSLPRVWQAEGGPFLRECAREPRGSSSSRTGPALPRGGGYSQEGTQDYSETIDYLVKLTQ